MYKLEISNRKGFDIKTFAMNLRQKDVIASSFHTIDQSCDNIVSNKPLPNCVTPMSQYNILPFSKVSVLQKCTYPLFDTFYSITTTMTISTHEKMKSVTSGQPFHEDCRMNE